jgi:hypothetical protein
MEHKCDSKKVNVVCVVSQKKIYGPFFFHEKTVTRISYLDMLQQFLLPQLEQDVDMYETGLIFQQDGAPPHFNLEVRTFLNTQYPNTCIGQAGHIALPPWSPDLTLPDFFLWAASRIRCTYTLY